jgi:hypothetical protein
VGQCPDVLTAETARPRGGRALVTANIKDFMPLDGQYRAAGQSHTGLILVSARAFPQDRSFVGAIASALAAVLDADQIRADQVIFLARP